jgi:hypothetical protein
MIEPSRRAALQEWIAEVESKPLDNNLRQRLLLYLQRALKAAAVDDEHTFTKWSALADWAEWTATHGVS